MLSSVKFKITIIAFLIISLIMVLSTWRDIRGTEQKLLDTQKEKVVLLSERISHSIMVLMLKNKWKDLQAFIEGLTRDSGEIGGIRVYHPESGLIVASSSRTDIGTKITTHDDEMLKKKEIKNAYLTEKNGLRYASKLSLIHNQTACNRCHGPEKEVLGVLGVDISLADVYASIDELKAEHFIDALIGFMLIGGGLMLVIGLLIDRPVKRMIRTIRRIEGGDLTARMDEDKKDEFGLMAKSFNRMLESLESAKQEIEMCHADQMQRAAKLASLGEIISGIAHEIKNPLTGISCAVQVLQLEMAGDDSKREVTTEILNHIRRLDRTVKDLLNYAKPKPPSFSPHQLEDILNKAVFFVYPEAKKHNVKIDTDLMGEVPDVMMDSDQMQQVFLNLMINAVQAMLHGGALKITISKTDREMPENDKIMELLPAEGAVKIDFTDTGKGIDAEYLDTIFDPFFTKKSKGTGLGLAISRRIVQEHGGEIVVKSGVGTGSKFTIYLPVMRGGKNA